MKVQLPIFEEKFKLLNQRIHQFSLIIYERKKLEIYSEEGKETEFNDLIRKSTQIISDFEHDLKLAAEKAGYIFDTYSTKIEEDISSLILDAIYQYDFELNKIDNNRQFVVSILDQSPKFYFKLLVKNEQVDEIFEYFIKRNEHHRNGDFDEYACDPLGRIKGRKNKGRADLGYLMATIDLVMEDLEDQLSYALTYFNENYTTVELIFCGSKVRIQ